MKRFTVIAGPCVIESESLVREVASELVSQFKGLNIDFYFKSSFDKANRSSIDSFRGPGLKEGLNILSKTAQDFGVKTLTDFHTPEQAIPVAEAVDFVQIPAFLCRQTDMIVAGAEACLEFGKKLNIKKGQFLAPWDSKNIIEKVRQVEAKHSKKIDFCLTERGISFGYNNLIVDMISFQYAKELGVEMIYDATHSVQKPGGGLGGKSTGGAREHIESLARAAMAAGATGVFLECHPRPDQAKSDGPNAFPLEKVGTFVRQLLQIHETVKNLPRVLG